MKVLFSVPVDEETIEYEVDGGDTIAECLALCRELLDMGIYNVRCLFDSGFIFRIVPFGSGLRSYPLGPAKSSLRDPNLSTKLNLGGPIT